MDEKIRIARYAGFCPGVKNAVDTVLKLAKNKKPCEHIYTLGKLIHNNNVINSLKALGVSIVENSDIDRLFESSCPECVNIVVVRAHGIPRDISQKLEKYSRENSCFIYYDCTCKYVKKIHRIVDRESEGCDALVVIGDINHPEVQSIVSYSKVEYYAASTLNELISLNIPENSVLTVAQTTQNLTEWKECLNFIKNHCTEANIFDTICSVTENRQNEARELASSVDLMYVIGSPDSSNSAKLLSVSRSVLPNSHMIEDKAGLDKALIRSADKIGITAGASTPGDIIEEVKITMIEEITNSENFEELLEGSLKTLNTGDIVSGVITSISSTEIHVDLSANVTGVLPLSEIVLDTNEKVEDKYKVGDEITAFVTRVSDIEGVAGLSRRRIERIADLEAVVAAKDSGEILEGKVTEVIKGGVIVTYKAVKLFVPASQTGIPKEGDLTSLLGSIVKVNVLETDTGRNRAVASIKSVQRKERKEALAKFWETLEVGQVFTGKVKSIVSYGAFVDLGFVDGLVHVTELSWKRIKSPADVISVGDELTVFVKSFDAEKKKVSLGYKTEETNPWFIFTSKYSEGDVASVKIENITPFGAFAEIVPDVDGLIHISQIADRRIEAPSEVLSVGQVVDAKIIAIDNEKKKVSLSIRALLTNDEDTEEAAEVTEE